jgi:glutamate synthase (NADPH/NADH) large chain
MLSGEVAKRYGHAGLPDDTIHVKLTGTAGQSFGAFLARGVTLELTAKATTTSARACRAAASSSSRARISAATRREHHRRQHRALRRDRGRGLLRRRRRRALRVRNSGATAVVEGVGDHGCEYMTGGTVVVLGMTGRNFAAGMSGGVAYVLDEDGSFEQRCNMAQVALEPVEGRRAPGSSPATSSRPTATSMCDHLGMADEALLKG